jgi:hypothetical protein
MTIGGWLTIRYRPSTTSPSFESACRLSLVRAFSAAFLAAFASFSVARFCGAFLSFFFPFDLPLLAPTKVSIAAISVASERCAYQMSIVDISANSAIAAR